MQFLLRPLQGWASTITYWDYVKLHGNWRSRHQRSLKMKLIWAVISSYSPPVRFVPVKISLSFLKQKKTKMPIKVEDCWKCVMLNNRVNISGIAWKTDTCLFFSYISFGPYFKLNDFLSLKLFFNWTALLQKLQLTTKPHIAYKYKDTWVCSPSL